MNKTLNKTLGWTASAAAASLLLAACGGSNNDSASTDTPPDVPASATASIEAFFSFTDSLMASETALPLDVDAVTPPTSETAEPLALD